MEDGSLQELHPGGARGRGGADTSTHSAVDQSLSHSGYYSVLHFV